MDVRRLDLLRELADRGSIAAVAAATHRTPSAVSQQLKVLEREAGVPLTERSGRGILLTDAGRALARSATDIAVAIERAGAVWDEYRNDATGTVSVATFPTAGQMLLPKVLASLRSTPGLDVTMADRDPETEDFPALTTDFDIVLAHSVPGGRSWSGRGLRNLYLLSEPLDIALPVGHRLAGVSVLTPEHLIDEPWIGVPEGYPFDRLLHEIEAVTGASLDVVQRVTSSRITEALVAAGIGISMIPRYTASGPERGIVTRPLTGVDMSRHIVALMRPDKAERLAVRTVAEALQREATALQQTHDPVDDPAPFTSPRWT
ncbi:LysR family transcriptional regulator [Mycetocola manganoxydans]|uniref:LysR family transcriptional regulator n=1 Tax=Mycetocola manganoxydans TaxID=699879 RepID=A0A3L6ZYP0_9MICO|nr:LysR family transcriptional regulator [Mycetocola manganoxydans]RLP72934.1 LysR family transcriptional regulator [Mycetocola manganoxydans]GHD44928.1 LysR family transcriptional regulator [Mycetocola manganoxydans]